MQVIKQVLMLKWNDFFDGFHDKMNGGQRIRNLMSENCSRRTYFDEHFFARIRYMV